MILSARAGNYVLEPLRKSADLPAAEIHLRSGRNDPLLEAESMPSAIIDAYAATMEGLNKRNEFLGKGRFFGGLGLGSLGLDIGEIKSHLFLLFSHFSGILGLGYRWYVGTPTMIT